MSHLIKCQHCGKQVEATGKGQKYCSKECKDAAAYERAKARREATRRGRNLYGDVTCKHCKKTFYGAFSRVYCSMECREADKPVPLRKRNVTCMFCGSKFVPHHAKAVCCGKDACRSKYLDYRNASSKVYHKKWVEQQKPLLGKECEHCDKKFSTTKLNQKFCSAKCREEHAKRAKVLDDQGGPKYGDYAQCKTCHDYFIVMRKGQIYCCQACRRIGVQRNRYIYRERKHPYDQAGHQRNCAMCGTMFQSYDNKAEVCSSPECKAELLNHIRKMENKENEKRASKGRRPIKECDE